MAGAHQTGIERTTNSYVRVSNRSNPTQASMSERSKSWHGGRQDPQQKNESSVRSLIEWRLSFGDIQQVPSRIFSSAMQQLRKTMGRMGFLANAIKNTRVKRDYFHFDTLLKSVEDGCILPVRGSALIHLDEYGFKCDGHERRILPRRQELEKDPQCWWTAKHLRHLQRQLHDKFGIEDGDRRFGLLFVCISYRWLDPTHPDRGKFQLKTIARIARLYTSCASGPCSLWTDVFEPLGKARHEVDFCVFWDYLSLHQKVEVHGHATASDLPERTDEQYKLFRQGLHDSSYWYAHRHTVLWLQTRDSPKSQRPFHSSGWCCFETALGSVLKDTHARLDLGHEHQRSATYEQLLRQCNHGKQPLLPPEEFERELDATDEHGRPIVQFTNGRDDRETIKALYRDHFMRLGRNKQHLHLEDLRQRQSQKALDTITAGPHRDRFAKLTEITLPSGATIKLDGLRTKPQQFRLADAVTGDVVERSKAETRSVADLPADATAAHIETGCDTAAKEEEAAAVVQLGGDDSGSQTPGEPPRSKQLQKKASKEVRFTSDVMGSNGSLRQKRGSDASSTGSTSSAGSSPSEFSLSSMVETMRPEDEESAARVIGHYLAQNDNLVSLDLTGVQLGAAGLRTIAQHLAHSSCTRLRYVATDEFSVSEGTSSVNLDAVDSAHACGALTLLLALKQHNTELTDIQLGSACAQLSDVECAQLSELVFDTIAEGAALDSICFEGVPLRRADFVPATDDSADSHTVNLSNAGLGPLDIAAVAGFLERGEAAVALDVSGNRLGPMGARYLARAVRTEKLAALRCVDGDLEGRRAMSAVCGAPAVLQNSSSKKKVRRRKTPAKRVAPEDPVLAEDHERPALDQLCAHGDGAQGAVLFDSASVVFDTHDPMRGARQLAEAWLRERADANVVGDMSGIEALAEATRKSLRLRRICLEGDTALLPTEPCEQGELNLTLRGLTPVSAPLIGRLLAQPGGSARIIKLKGNALGPLGARYIARGLAGSLTVEELDLSDNLIGSLGCRELVEAMRTNNSLRRLTMTNNALAASDALALGSVIGEAPDEAWLTLLRLNSNSAIGAVGATHLIDQLRSGRPCPLKTLAVRHCMLSTEVKAALKSIGDERGIEILT